MGLPCSLRQQCASMRTYPWRDHGSIPEDMVCRVTCNSTLDIPQ
jgi:hypothetical protein